MRTRSRQKRDLNFHILKLHSFHSGDRVENAPDKTQVFIEFQILRREINRTSGGLLFNEELVSGELFNCPLTLRLFQIHFTDLLSSDIFRNSNLDPLLSMDILADHHFTSKFWNIFKRYISRCGNKAGKHWLKKKPRRMIIIIVPVVLTQTHAIGEAKEKAYLEKLLVTRHTLACNRKFDEEEEEFDPPAAVLETMKFSIEENNSCCSICLEEFKLGTNTLELYCEHIFHRDCIIRWINASLFMSCPIFRDDTGASYC